ncbi:endonuclease [Paenalcaligenes hominis]|uniref:Endonuclease n=1 Tax=Paenalcaligenes hominis TaxID=643674 RepID=A0A1U9JYU3_9BURK|nr:endonuclease [Paenalcaligenes hominis]AQS50931.1 endonuclease [Paenalcaligenes hominis]
MKRLVTVFLFFCLVGPSLAADLVTRKNEVGHRNFNRAKTLLPQVFNGLNQTFYCGCSYTDKTVDLNSCGYRIRKDPRRAGRVEWEHVVPAWAIGHQRQCWQNGGRANCSKNDAVYAKAEGDMHNLVPAIGEVNNDRGNFRFSVWTQSPPRMYGQCGMLVDFKARRVQPPESVRGKIARITFYMVNEYRLNLSAQERRLYCVWAKAYPVDRWEQIRNQRVAAIQGNTNPFVSQPNLIDRICR